MNDTASRPLATKGGFTAGHAVVIGIANYRNANALPDAVTNDARDVAGILTSDAYCGYRTNNVHVLLDEDATLARITTALDAVAKASGPNDSVVIFFSGHGALLGDPANAQSGLLPVEFDIRTPDTTSLSETEFSSFASANLRATSTRAVRCVATREVRAVSRVVNQENQ